MIKHILKIIWHQRRNNGWIFVELLLVFAVYGAQNEAYKTIY